MARLAHVPAHGPHGHEELGDVVGRGAAGQGVVVHEHDLVILTDGLGEPADVLYGSSANGAGPFGRLRGAVVVAHQVAAEVLLQGGVGGHVIAVEADAVGVQEVVVHHVLLDHLVAHAQHEGRIGAGQHRHPAGLEVRCRGVVRGPDVDELHAGIAGLVEVVHGGAARGPGGVAAHDHDGVGVLVVEAVVQLAQILGGKPERYDVEGVGSDGARIGKGDVAAELVENLAHGQGLGADDGRRAELAVDALGLLGNVVDGLFPADLLPLVAPAQLTVGIGTAAGLPALALHGELHPIFAEDLLGPCPPARASALLQPLEAVLMGSLAALAHHFAVAHEHAVHAAAAAVVPACCSNPDTLVHRCGAGGTGQAFLRGRRARRASDQRRQGPRRNSGDGTALQKPATRKSARLEHVLRIVHCVPLLSLLDSAKAAPWLLQGQIYGAVLRSTRYHEGNRPGNSVRKITSW